MLIRQKFSLLVFLICLSVINLAKSLTIADSIRNLEETAQWKNTAENLETFVNGDEIESIVAVMPELISDIIEREEQCMAARYEENTNPLYIPQKEKIDYIVITNSERYRVSILEPLKLLDILQFNKIAIVIFGLNSNPNVDERTEFFAKAYNCRQDWNFIIMDSAELIRTDFGRSALNTLQIGTFIAESLALLMRAQPNLIIHVVGHSLGAQIAGRIGRELKRNSNICLPRIVGLDPTNACFRVGQGELRQLSREDADEVIIMHTSPGRGSLFSTGHADFFVNGLSPFVPGCDTILCAHNRAYEYFTESLFPGSEYNFIAKQCSTAVLPTQRSCNGAQQIMGFATPPGVRGKYYVQVKPTSPYGKNGTYSLEHNLAKCQEKLNEESIN